MKKHFLIMTVGVTLHAADQIPTQIINKAQTEIPSTFIMKEDERGTIAAGIVITADLQGNAATATQADQARTFTEPLAGDVIGNQTSTVVVSVGGQTAEQVAAAVQKIVSATAANIPGTLLMRDEQGNCATTSITADVQGNSATATYALQAGSAEKAIKAESALYAETANKAVHATEADHTLLADKAASAEQAAHALYSDKSVQADHAIYADQADKATQALQSDASLRSTQSDCAECARTFTEPLAGDVVGDQKNTVIASVGGQSATAIAAAVQKVEHASSDANNESLVCRDAKGDFSARNIKATLLGNATTAGHANTFNKPLDGDVTGKQFSTVVNRVGGQLATQIAAATQTVQTATAAVQPTTLIMRDAQGDFSAHVITADLQGNAATATQATHAITADHALSADQATEATRALQADAALRSAQSVCAECADTARLFTEPLAGDVAGNQNSTLVTMVGGQPAEQVALATQRVQAATADNNASSLVLRDDAGNFATTMVTVHGAVTNPTDVATKHYVDTAVAAHASEQQYVVPAQVAHALKADYTLCADKAAHADTATIADKALCAEQATSALQSDTSLRAAQAECAACAHIFTEPLVGDVVGNQSNTVVATVGGYTAEQIAAAVHKINTTPSEVAPIMVTTDGGNAVSKAGRLAIRGGQNLKVRGSDASVVIALAPSPSVTGSLTAGTTITAGTGLQVMSGGAAITGDTKINIAGSGSTTIGNPTSMTIYNGPLCFKQVNQGIGMPLGIDDEGNVVLLESNVRVHHEADKKLYHAVLQALINTIKDQHKRIERIEQYMQSNNG